MKRGWFASLFTAVSLGTPDFEGKQVAKHDDLKPVEQAKPSKLATQGTVQQVNKHYGRTIAGGPGSQRIGDTFDRLPQHIKDQMIEARKGKVRFPTRDEIAEAMGSQDTPEGGYVPKRDMTGGVTAAQNRVYGDTPEKRVAEFKKIDAELKAQRAASPTGRLEDYEPPKPEESNGKPQETKADT